MSSIYDVINDLISKNGFIEVDKFVQICLYHDKYGYYKQQNPFGLKGDFVTSPQMTSLFGDMIALYIASYFNKVKEKNNSQKLTIVELGGGNGFFMRDCLSTIKQFPDVYNEIDVIMVESSEKLSTEQKAILRPFTTKSAEISNEKSNKNQNPVNIKWISNIYDLEDNIEDDRAVFFFSNEFFDAFCTKQFIKIDSKWREIVVKQISDEPIDTNENNISQIFYQFAHNSSIDFSNLVEEFLLTNSINEDLEEESIVEISPDAISAYDYISKITKKHQGQILTIDYGYTKPSFNSTIKAVMAHKEVDVLSNLGIADITHLVNFNTLNNISIKNGLTSYGIITQGDFFRSIGIEKRLEIFCKSQEQKLQSLTQNLTKNQEEIKEEIKKEIDKINAKLYLTKTAVERIISPSQMGSLFKVLLCAS
jgi:NADH dehydrogenase [ubiquinone] 1 alpha subcomplex assembly factor 7